MFHTKYASFYRSYNSQPLLHVLLNIYYLTFPAYPEAQRKTTSSVPATNTERLAAKLRHVKSTSDLIKNKNLSLNLLQENPEVSQNPRGAEQNETRNNNIQEKDKPKEKILDAQKRVEKQRLEEQKKLEKQRLEEQKKLEKQRLEEQKKQEKLALQEQAKQEKLRKEKEKQEAQLAKKDKKKKRAAPPRPIANPLGQANTSTSNNPLAQGQTQYTTNTLESSISKTSGPPPYTEIPKPEGENDSTGNVTYSKPIDTGSWDMISKHRENINRPVNTASTKQSKQMMMDLKFKLEEGNKNRDNSEA